MKIILTILGTAAAFLGKLVAAAVLAFVAVGSAGYLFVPVYDFVSPEPFSGDSIYNPYEGVDFGQAKKAIMHFHTSLSDGSDEPEVVAAAYRDMGCEIISVADHHRVTPTGGAPSRELGTYEHGLNACRFHNVVFGAGRPSLFLLPLWQGVSAREETLRRLSERFGLVVLNHPAGVRALGNDQMERLSHYDYIEADRAMDREQSAWDVALSAGHYSFVMANDDLHDLARPGALGRAMTFVMTPSVEAEDVLKALEAGHTYAVRVANPAQTSDSVHIPSVKALSFTGDTLRVAFSEPSRVRFVGQGGVVLCEVFSDEANYVFRPEDTYVRLEARFEASGFQTDDENYGAGAGGTTIYLNPIARYSSVEGAGLEAVGSGARRPLNASYSVRNLPMTVLSVVGYALLILASLAGIYILFRGKRKFRRMK